MFVTWNDLNRSFLSPRRRLFGWPDRSFDQLHRQMNRLFEDFGDEPRSTGGVGRANLYDAGDELVLTAELPGAKLEDIEVTVIEDNLSISAEIAVEIPEGYRALRQERASEHVSSTIQLPSTVDPERAAASLTDGILTVRLAKAAEAKPRRIEVTS